MFSGEAVFCASTSELPGQGRRPVQKGERDWLLARITQKKDLTLPHPLARFVPAHFPRGHTPGVLMARKATSPPC